MYTYKSVYIYIYIYIHTQWYTRIENIYITTGWTLTCDSDRQTDTHAHATNSLNSHRRLQRGRSPMLARPRRTSISYLRLVKIFEPWSQNPLRDVDRVYVWCLCACVCVCLYVYRSHDRRCSRFKISYIIVILISTIETICMYRGTVYNVV